MKNKINIEMTEGCICFSYTINGIEWTDLTDPDNENFNIKLVNQVFEALVDELTSQYSIPPFMVSYLYDGYYESDELGDLLCTQDTFINCVKANKNCKENYLGTCDDCGDMIYEYKLEIQVETKNQNN